MKDLYKNCRICPRDCGADRTAGINGYCGEGSELRLAFAGLHFGEEPPLVGRGGSGTIFISGCNLGCAFCQNWQISSPRSHRYANSGGSLGRAVSVNEFTGICLNLQKKGAENINIVTGSHAIPALALGIKTVKAKGLKIPILWNSSGYEKVDTLELLSGCIDVFLPDLKTLDNTLSGKFFNAPNYPQAATKAISWMIENPAQIIIRHLILPGLLESTHSVLKWFAENAAGKALLSIMSQYTPPAAANSYSPGRFVTKKEYETVIGWLEEFGIEDGYCQELVSESGWLPDFRRENPFLSKLSVPVWNY